MKKQTTTKMIARNYAGHYAIVLIDTNNRPLRCTAFYEFIKTPWYIRQYIGILDTWKL